MKNIIVVTYWSYKDALVQTYTLPYVKVISNKLKASQKIYLITIDDKKFRLSKDEYKSEKELLLEHNIHLINFNYSNFGLLMILNFFYIFSYLFFLIILKNISHIHTWCTPAGSIGYILSVLTGRKLILDSYEPQAEPMVESNTWKKSSLKFKLLFWLEKKQLQRASIVITCVASMKDYVKEKFNFNLTKSYSKPACIDFNLFDISKSNNRDLIKKHHLEDKVIGIYAGKFGGNYLKEEVFEFLKVAEDFWGADKFRFILLTSHSKSFVQGEMEKFNLKKETIIQLFVSHKEVPNYMGLAHFGITPFVPVPSKRYGTPIKNGEYWAMGLPVIITKNISDDSEIIEKEDIGYVLKELNNVEYTKACQKINELIENDSSLKIRDIAIQYRNFKIADKIYKDIYELN